MKDKIAKFAHKNSLNSILLLLVIFFGFLLSLYLFFNSYKTTQVEIYSKKYNLYIENMNSKLENYLKFYNKSEIEQEIKKLVDTKIFESIKLNNQRYIFSSNTLFKNSNNIDDKSWNLVEVAVDAKFGYITKIPKSKFYEFVPSSDYDINEPVNIRFQLYKKGEIKNIISKIDFSDIEIVDEKNREISSIFSLFIDLDTKDRVYNLKIENFNNSTVIYSFNNNLLIEDLKYYLLKLLLFSFILFVPIIFVLAYYHKFLFNKYVITPVNYLNEYLDDILENKFRVLDKSKFEGTKEIKDLTKKISKISTKIASLENELNINKESLELKSSTDPLTGLPNKDIFDFDLKTMFVSMTKGFVFDIRVDKLAEISKNYDTGYINSFIESYTNIIKNIIFKHSKTDIKLYRFYGSKFAVVAKKIDMEIAQKISEEIIYEITDRLPDIYDVPNDLIQIGVTAFDLHGSVESIIESAENAYEKAKEKGPNSYYIVGLDAIEKNYALLDNTVEEVLEKADFQINYVLDSFLFDNPEKLVMNEASPQLFDHDNNKLQIGSFISVAQKLNLADKFDKLVIEKVIDYIKKNQIIHEIAINLSISSIQNDNFMNWLEQTLLDNSEIRDRIVFSITSYTAYLHKDIFEEFVKKVHEMKAKVILKRYKTDEYPLTQLEFLNLDYIRINKDYTTNFTNDLVKKHKVKNIVIFAELNNIKVITDSVKIDADYDMLERLGTYATSR